MKALTLMLVLLNVYICKANNNLLVKDEIGESESAILLEKSPSNYQVLQRNDQNQCHISIEGWLATAGLRSDFTVNILSRSGYDFDYELVTSESIIPEPDGSFSIDYVINAELKEWKFVLTNSVGSEIDERTVEHVACGDIYALLGQSNAFAAGNEMAPHINLDHMYQNRYARAVGQSIYGYEDKEPPSNFLGWGPAGAHFYSSFFSGGLGLAIQGEIIENHNIPVGLINASYPGTKIEVHLESSNSVLVVDPPYISGSGYNLFEFFLSKLDRAGATNTLKTILWYQGESDRELEEECGNRYMSMFRELRNSWYSHLPALENIYIYQLNTTCVATLGGQVARAFNEAQRELDLVHPDITLIPTVGLTRDDIVQIKKFDTIPDPSGSTKYTVVPCYDNCHYTYSGMIKNAIRTIRFLEKQTYTPSNYTDQEVFASHPESSNYDAATHTLAINFKYNIDLLQVHAQGYSNEEVKDYFFDENDNSILIDAMSISGSQLLLSLNSSQIVPQSISYLPNFFYHPQTTNKDFYFGPWLISKYGKINKTIDYVGNPVPPLSIQSVIGVPFFHNLSVRPTAASNDWLKVWSNEGHNDIDLHQIHEDTEIIAGDFNGDGEEELLIISSTWISVLKFQDNNWKWLWSNLGGATHSINAFHGEHFLVGDFNGNGKDQLFCNNSSVARIFSFNSNGFSLDWASNGAINAYLDHIVAGDFDGDGKTDLLGSNLSLDYSSLFFFNSNNFQVDWTTDPNHSAYASNHQWFKDYQGNLKAGNFDNTNKDLVLGLGGYATVFYYHDKEWHWLWSDLGAGSIGGWAYPLNSIDELHIGHLDNDGKEELLFLQNGINAEWATSIDFNFNGSAWDWNWNWSINPINGKQHIADWPLEEGSGNNTRYLLAKLRESAPEHLIAMRKFPCNEESRYLINVYEPINTNKKRASTGYSKLDEFSVEKENSSILMLQVYPNPNDGNMELDLRRFSESDCFQGEVTVKCYTSRGTEIKKSKVVFNEVGNAQLNYHDLSPGFYTLILNCNKHTIHQKVIIR